MSFLSKIFNKKLTSRVMGKLAPYSISFIACKLQWENSRILESGTKYKVDNLDGIFLLTLQSNPLKCDSFVRVFIYKENTPSVHATFDIKTAENLESEVIEVSGYRATRARWIEKEKLQDDTYHENILMHINTFSILFELYIVNNHEPLKETVIKDFLGIVNSLKV